MFRKPSHAYPMIVLLAAVAAVAVVAADADWPQFRGVNRDGISKETGLALKWPEGGPSVLWRAPLGGGFSGVSVVAGKLYTSFSDGEDEASGCFDAATGKQLWRTRIDSVYKDRFGDGPRATPTVDGNTVYVVSARGKLHALSAADGKVLWSRDYVKDFGSSVPQWGFSTSPLVEGKLLLTDVGGADGSSIVAFDKKTGKEVWRSHGDKAGYSAPIAVTVGKQRQVVFFTAKHLVGVAPADGKVLWTQPWETSYDVNAATPVFIAPDRIFVSSGYDVGGAVYRIGGSGIEEVWRNREMKNKFSSSVLHDGHLYGFDEKMLKCIDAATGKTLWQARGFDHGTVLLAQGHLIVLGEKGTLALVEATPKAFREKSRFQVFDGKTWTMPTLAGGKLYLRDQSQLVALDVSG